MEDTRPEWGKKFSKYCFIPARFVLTFMCFASVVNAFTMRVCLSMAITRIVVKIERNETGETVCPPSGSGASDYEGGEYDWSQSIQGLILSSFYIGYVITHIPGGILAEKYGGKYVLGLGILSTAIFTILTPFVIEYTEAIGLICLRILIGFGEGTTFPAVSMLLGQWIPKKERGAVGSLVLGGSIFGTVVSNVSSGYMLAHWDWQYVFYAFGAAAILWFIIFVLTCFSDPSKHPYIKETEMEYLVNELGGSKRSDDLPPPPFKDILTSVPFLAMLLAQLGHDWGFFIMITDLPKYMNDVLRFSIQSNGVYSSVPFITMYVVILLGGFLTDYTIKKGWIGVSASRRLNTAIGAIGPGIFMVAASYAGCDHIIVVILFTCCMIAMAPYYSGLRLNPLDMSPNYAGTLMAISNGFAAITGAIAPSIAGLLTPNATLTEWRIVFWISLGILTLTVIWYCFKGTGEIQPWNEGSVKDKDKEQNAEKGKKRRKTKIITN